MDPFEAYTMFLALRAHFNQKSYNYHRYNGKVRTNYDSFLRRKDRFFFTKLGRKPDPEGYALANLLENPKLWISDLFDQNADDVYTDWVKRRDSLSHQLQENISKMDDDFNKNFEVINGQHPKLLELYLENEVSHETMIILNELTSSFKTWNKKIDDEIIWPEIYLKLKKYRDFMNISGSIPKFQKIIIDRFTKTV